MVYIPARVVVHPFCGVQGDTAMAWDRVLHIDHVAPHLVELVALLLCSCFIPSQNSVCFILTDESVLGDVFPSKHPTT